MPRIFPLTKKVVSSGTVSVAVGPEFGPGNANDQSASGLVRVGLAMPALAVAGILGDRAALAMPSLAAVYATQTTVAALTMPALIAAYNAQTTRAAVGTVDWVTSATLASKDAWVSTVGQGVSCTDDTNKDTTDLQVEGVAATSKSTMVGFDLSGFPSSGVTIVSATLTLNLKTAPAVATTDDIFSISSGNETWAEGTVKCSTEPAAVANLGSLTVPTSTGDKTFAVPSSDFSRITGRMGVGTYSFRINGTNTATANHIYQSKDSTGTLTNGPRLTLHFTTTHN